MRSVDKTEKLMMDEMYGLRKRVAEMEQAEALQMRVDTVLKTSQEDYHLLANNVIDVIWTMDLNLRFTYFSPSVTGMMGYSNDEALRLTLPGILTPASYEILLKTVAEQLALENMKQKDPSRVCTLELEHLCKDGSTLWVETKMGFVRDQYGQAIGFIGVARDISERRRMEKQLQQTQLLASLGEMTAGIAHEINNPLGSILLFSELMMKSNVSRQMKKDLRVIHGEATRAARIMTDLLTFSLGTISETRRSNLHRIINKVLEMRRYAQSVQNISASTNLDKTPVYINCVPSQLKHVFMHLVLNAEEVLQKQNGGHIIITTRKYGEWVRISIADDGPGIAEEHLQGVFHPFYTTKEPGDGTGLGLSTCHGIITTHGGLIHAENNRMGGATFTVELPMV